MRRTLLKFGRSFELVVLKNRLGKSRFSARVLIFTMRQFDRFELYENHGDIGNFDHYVPKFLLRFFGKNNGSAKKGIIFSFSFKKPGIRERPIKGVAGEIDHDTFREKTGRLSDFISKNLYSQKVERFGKHVIGQLNQFDEKSFLTFFEESVLVTFIACQMTRVPAFHGAIKRYIEFFYENGSLEIKDLASLENIKSKIVQNGLGASIDDLLLYRPNFSIEGIKNHIGVISRLIANDIAEKIYSGNMHIVDIPDGSEERFVISDNPIILLDMDRLEVLRYPAWWDINKLKLCIFMPISPTRCIFYTKSKKRGGIIEKNDLNLVEVINFGQYLNAQECVFGSDKKVMEKQLWKYAGELINLKLRW
jgi:hypothetical protein